MNKKRILTGLLIVVVFVSLGTIHFPFSEEEDIPGVPLYTPREKAEFLYGVNRGKFEVETMKIRANQTLVSMLEQFSLPKDELNFLVSKASSLINLKGLRKGDKYTVFLSPKNKKSLRCLVYEPSPTHYLFIDLRDSVHVTRVDRVVERKTIVTGGEIRSSLYQTMTEQKIPANMVIAMADIYSCTIDFFRIQKGDHFKMVLEDEFVEGKALGTGKIKAVCFNHTGKDYYAYFFSDGTVKGYYDSEMNAMKKQFLRAPLKFSTITSKFAKKRFHPVLKVNKPHLGTDYAAPSGTPVMAVGDGTILEAKYSIYNGNYVKIKHNQTYTTQYLHFSKIKSGIRPGVRVKQGDVIGYVGSTGLATGPHVCFRFWKNGVQSDPFAEKAQFAEPLPARYKDDFRREMQALKAELDKPADELLP